MAEIIAEMRSVTKRFPGVVANDDVSIAVRKGEIFALLGENGAGKSTLMSMLFGLYEPDEGDIYIRGERVRISSPAHASSLSIGMVHQHFRLVENFTIAENIVLGLEPKKRKLGFLPYVDMKTANEKIRELSKQYGLEVNPKAVVEDVGISIRQRVEILKMLYRQAEILIFDEPTAMLAPQEVEYLLEILNNLRKAGKTIILISHKLEEIKKTADRCAILNHGKLIGIYDVATTTTKQMAAGMVGRELTDELPPPEQEFRDEVLRVEDLSVVLPGRDKTTKIENVSFSIRGGEVFAIAGVDGNGQTELTDAIAGLIKVTTGKISIDGTDITKADVRERVELGMSYVPEDRQATGLLLDFPLDDNIILRQYYKAPFSKRGVLDDKAAREYAETLIERYDIRSGHGADTMVRSMSGGNQQKIIVAREIELGSKLLIFVQPTRGLDIGAIRTIHSHILEQRSRGRAILLVSFELEEIAALADTVGVIYGGKINRIAPSKDISVEEMGEYMTGVKQ